MYYPANEYVVLPLNGKAAILVGATTCTQEKVLLASSRCSLYPGYILLNVSFVSVVKYPLMWLSYQNLRRQLRSVIATGS